VRHTAIRPVLAARQFARVGAAIAANVEAENVHRARS
jgi:hypothetical protein